ncbi:hypothetical protein BU23DRAFT_558262 [Bimuria novae-zelandiae CBS 107.79]|uniref:Uncharacterized protein n=1 Tax=Bimuria novae-zelandiae CBS 107.79 TaxID=1447943 RepID=A0A6A5UV81_9PLEO|nr:hypothetical protein BU23DRAFT_558262 [Bimuria novae-zelandiae CBS 107.79]
MHAIRRSCRTALFGTNATHFLDNGSRRAFSRSAALHRGTLPVYLPASSPELSQMLSTLNSKILLPKHLTPEQEKLVYKPENRAKLEQEPIEITLGDVTLPLEHIDRNTDIPDFGRHFADMAKASKTPEDWENMVRVLEGCHNAGIGITSEQAASVLRRLSNNGMQHLVLKLLQRARATGVRLRDFDTIGPVLRAVRDKAWKSGWEKEELKKALRMAEQVVELMDNDEHLGKATGVLEDHRTHPSVLAVPLEMAAELAYRHDVRLETAKKYAPRFMNALKQRNFMADHMENLDALTAQTEADFNRNLKQVRAVAYLHNRLLELIPIWNALSSARTVLDAEMPMADDAERVQRQLRELLKMGEDTVGILSKRKGKSLTSDGPDSYHGYLKRAIRACEDDGEDEE